MAAKIYVNNLSESTSESDLIECFSKVGHVITARVVKSIDGKKNNGTAYITMSNPKEATEAINKLNRTEIKGNKIKVMELHFMDRDDWHFPTRYRPRRR